MIPATLQALLAARAAARPVVLATRLSDGEQLLMPEADAPPLVRDAAVQALDRDESGTADIDGEQWFFHVHAPAYRLIVVGAVHIAQALVEGARPLGYRITVVDPRRPFNSAERFPGVERLHDWPDQALDALAPDKRTAVVALTHDPKLDDPALDRALHSTAGFIGALGSRRSQTARLARLAALGHDADTLARVRGPVGLALGSVSASEIALSILAEIVAVRRGAALGARS
jgi:xanthine dehydrogenase accessory factor